MRQANTAVLRERYPTPTVEEVLHDINGSTVFSKLDLRWGFHQVQLDAASRNITTFAVEDGLYRFKRLMFGLSSAPEKYPKIIQQVISGCAGALNIADIIVYGRTLEEHDANLFQVLNKLQDQGLTLNGKKCWFRRSEITFELRVSANGVAPTPKTFQAIVNASAPQSAAEVRSFLGTIGFSARFLHDLATTTELLPQLTRTGTTFTWGSEQQKAFDALKAQLTAAPALAFFDEDAELEVIADASPVGLGAMLVQIVGSDHHVVSYASRTPSTVERRYSQTEREALGLVWACERFRQYLFGRHFTLVTDHKPLECIYSPRSRPSARIERWVLRLQSFDYKVRYIAGKDNCADALSRLPIQDTSARGRGFKESVRLVVSAQAPVTVDIRDIEEASATDPELLAVAKAVHSSD